MDDFFHGLGVVDDVPVGGLSWLWYIESLVGIRIVSGVLLRSNTRCKMCISSPAGQGSQPPEPRPAALKRRSLPVYTSIEQFTDFEELSSRRHGVVLRS